MIAEGLVKLSELIGVSRVKAEQVHETERERFILIDKGPGRDPEVRTFKKEPFERSHAFATLDGLVDYLGSKNCEGDGGVIFVGEEQILCDLRYGKPGVHRSTLALTESEEFLALGRLAEGVGQKQLWRLLTTKLFGCVSEELLLGISSLTLVAKQEAEADIQTLGLVKASGREELKIVFPAKNGEGSQAAQIAKTWEFEVRIWECFPQTFKIETSLEVEKTKEGGLVFIFHPRRLETVCRIARLNLVAVLKSRVEAEKFTVHEGEFEKE